MDTEKICLLCRKSLWALCVLCGDIWQVTRLSHSGGTTKFQNLAFMLACTNSQCYSICVQGLITVLFLPWRTLVEIPFWIADIAKVCLKTWGVTDLLIQTLLVTCLTNRWIVLGLIPILSYKEKCPSINDLTLLLNGIICLLEELS